MSPLDKSEINVTAPRETAGAVAALDAQLTYLKPEDMAGTDLRFVDWRFIGTGGSADVYRVFDRFLSIDLAIKILKRDSPAGRDTIRNEVLISRALRHPSICPVHDIYSGDHGFGVIMDVLEGYDLKVWAKVNNTALHATFEARVALVEKLADALAIAHSRIVHRDLKPANIFLINGSIEQPLIMDFGLSLLDQSEIQGSHAGTPRYMAPEQHGGVADARSDIFALGVMAYELLTGGRRPLGETVRRPTAEEWQTLTIAPPSAHCALINGPIDRLILQMLQYDPAKRPSSAAEIVRALRAASQTRAEAPTAASAQKSAHATATLAPGKYVIGSPPTSQYAAEKPMRRVQLTGCRIALRPVTNADYLAFCRETGAAPPPLIEYPVFGAATHPVVSVDWAMANAYAEWAGGRLPTEAEWEAAAKAGATMQVYPWGDGDLKPESANADNSVGGTTPVGAYPLGANGLGLEDMAGNVWEWCADAFDERAYRSFRDAFPDPITEPSGSADLVTVERVLRGGAFDALPAMCRTAFRHRAPANAARKTIGFRIVFDFEERTPT